MNEYFEIILILILFVGLLEFVNATLAISGIRDYFITYFSIKRRIKVIWKALNCDFCFSWWIGILLITPIMIYVEPIYLIPMSAIGWYWIFK